MKIYTDRYETVIPDSLRRRYRVPCNQFSANAATSEQPITDTANPAKQPTHASGEQPTSKPQNKDGGKTSVAMPSVTSNEANSNGNHAKSAALQSPGCITKTTASHSKSNGSAASATANGTTGTLTRALKPLRNEAPPLREPFPWIFAGMIALLIGVASVAPILAYLADQKDKAETAPTVAATPAPIATPVATPVHEPTPFPNTELIDLAPTPFPHKELADAVRAITSEVRRAEPVTGNVLYTGQVPMPYGGTQAVRVLGILPNQEALPALGAAIGDAYVIGRYLFVWVAPGGVGQWIDPVIIQ